MDSSKSWGYTPRVAGTTAARAIAVGHLTITLPAILAALLTPFLGLRTFGPGLFVYYVLAGIALGWQWYSVAFHGWTRWVAGTAADAEEMSRLAGRSALVWPVDTLIGPFALHTSVAALCGVHFGPWLISRWYAWIMPLSGMGTHHPTGNDYLQHFELASVAPAFVVGYVVARRFPRLATCAWIVPTIVLAFKILTFHEPPTSVFAPHSSTRFQYFFVIQRTMPTFAPDFGGVDPIRAAEQLLAVAPFYASLAYTAGALAAGYDLWTRAFAVHTMPAEAESTRAGQHFDIGAPDGPNGPPRNGT